MFQIISKIIAKITIELTRVLHSDSELALSQFEWQAREVCYLDLTGFWNFSEFLLFNVYSITLYKIKTLYVLMWKL
jgi:hypothetical protein